MKRQCYNHLGQTKGRKGTEKRGMAPEMGGGEAGGSEVDATISQGRWEREVAAQQEVEAPADAWWQRDKKPRWNRQLAYQSAMTPPWFCDELWAGGGCMGGHLFFYPN